MPNTSMLWNAIRIISLFNAFSALDAFTPSVALSRISSSPQKPIHCQSSSALYASSEQKKDSIGYRLKQFIVDAIAGGDYDAIQVNAGIDAFVSENLVAVFSFRTCPYCVKAKAVLDARGIKYATRELDLEDNRGSAVRAELGRRYKRTSVPAIFVRGQFIGGCNDGPGLIPTLASGEFDRLLAQGMKKQDESERT